MDKTRLLNFSTGSIRDCDKQSTCMWYVYKCELLRFNNHIGNRKFVLQCLQRAVQRLIITVFSVMIRGRINNHIMVAKMLEKRGNEVC